MWNIKRFVYKGNYIYAVVPDHPKATKNGYVLFHRIIMENKIGRLLEKREQVHHINGDTYDNRQENLEIMMLGEHQRFHMKQRYMNKKLTITVICKNCGIEFERRKSILPNVKGTINIFCSRKCNGQYNGFQKKIALVTPLASNKLKE